MEYSDIFQLPEKENQLKVAKENIVEEYPI